MYRFPKREASLMAMSYSYELQAKVFDKMTALEAKPITQLPTTYIEALEHLLASKKAEVAAIEQRDQAIATKALIGSKREATAMATASSAVREVAKLKHRLGHNILHATFIAVEKALGKKFGPQDWHPLSAWCKDRNIIPESIPCDRYGSVKAWPASAWSACWSIDLNTLFN
jgi:hypothetical protein